jgi:hypothetical protein
MGLEATFLNGYKGKLQPCIWYTLKAAWPHEFIEKINTAQELAESTIKQIIWSIDDFSSWDWTGTKSYSKNLLFPTSNARPAFEKSTALWWIVLTVICDNMKWNGIRCRVASERVWSGTELHNNFYFLLSWFTCLGLFSVESNLGFIARDPDRSRYVVQTIRDGPAYVPGPSGDKIVDTWMLSPIH